MMADEIFCGRLELLTALIPQAFRDSTQGKSKALENVLSHLVKAPKTLIGPGVTALAEGVRTEDLGVTIRSLDTIRFPIGASWWEWDRNVPGFLPAENKAAVIDRSGIFVLTPDGQHGVMHGVDRHPNILVGGKATVVLVPLSVTFDFRSEPEPIKSIAPVLSASDVRYGQAHAVKPTGSQMDAMPAELAQLWSRFGVIECSYYDAENSIGAMIESLKADADEFEMACAESSEDAVFMACIMLASKAPSVATVQYPAGPKWKGRTPRKSDSVFGYSVIDVVQ